jgi:hypothetical protein
VTPSRLPNLVVVMADQHRADAMGCAGDPTVLTPNLDAIAAEAVRFSRVSCQGPLCMPARASFLTERYVRDHGVYTNWAAVPAGSPTYLHALRDVAGAPEVPGSEGHPAEDVNLVADPTYADARDELTDTIVRPFLATPAARPHPSPFA